MRLVSIMLTLALLAVQTPALALTDPLGRKLYLTKPPPPNSGFTGIQQVGRLAKPPVQQPVPEPSTTPAPSSGACSIAPTTTNAASGCATTPPATAAGAGPEGSGTFQRLRLGKIDFAHNPDPGLNQAIKAAIVGGATAKTAKPGSTPQQASQKSGSAPLKAPTAPSNQYVPSPR